MDSKLALFQGKKVRKVFHKDEWWFVIADVIVILTDSTNPTQYLKNMRVRDAELFKGGVQIEPPLWVETAGGRQKLNCANTEGILRLIQSIPSPKAEPFKLWLAQVGYERIQEIKDPELSTKRARDIYKAKGYSDDWIEKRMKGIEVRDELTSEWGKRKVKVGKEFAILSSEISKATFGMTPTEYKKFKNLKSENLRDHMDSLELIYSMLGEATTIAFARIKNAQGFQENKIVARKGGMVAGVARKSHEQVMGEKVSKRNNYLLKLKNKDKK